MRALACFALLASAAPAVAASLPENDVALTLGAGAPDGGKASGPAAGVRLMHRPTLRQSWGVELATVQGPRSAWLVSALTELLLDDAPLLPTLGAGVTWGNRGLDWSLAVRLLLALDWRATARLRLGVGVDTYVPLYPFTLAATGAVPGGGAVVSARVTYGF